MNMVRLALLECLSPAELASNHESVFTREAKLCVVKKAEMCGVLRADKRGIEFFEDIGVDVLLAGDGPGELLQNAPLGAGKALIEGLFLLGTEDSLEEGHGVKVGVDATRAGFRSNGSRPSPASWADGMKGQLANQAFTSSLCTTSWRKA